MVSKYSDIAIFLYEAAMGSIESMQELLDSGLVDINDKDDIGLNALFVVSNIQEKQDFLFDNGIDIDAFSDKRTINPLRDAISEGKNRLFNNLLNRGVDLKSVDIEGMQALSWAAVYKEEGMLKKLIEANMDINHEDLYKKTAIFYAIENDWGIGLNMLLKSGANPYKLDEDGLNAFQYAEVFRAKESIELLRPYTFTEEVKKADKLKNNIKSRNIKKITFSKGI